MQARRGTGIRWRQHALVLCLFAGLVVAMTYPQVLHLADAARDWGDPLLNAWIMWWEYDAVTSGNLAGFLDANIFFPHRTTLAYSEFLLTESLIGAPVLALSDNPLLAHNVVLLLALLATAFATYLLARYLTGNTLAGVVAGIAMAFSPFMFDHLSQIQVIAAAGLPAGLLLLHRYFDDGSKRYLLGFTLVYVAQSLANGYYAVYLTYLAGGYIIYRAVIDERLTDRQLWRELAVHLAPAAVLLATLFIPYVRLRDQLGFAREMSFAAEWTSFFATAPINRLYGGITAPWRIQEGALFPCLTVVVLAACGIFAGLRRNGSPPIASDPQPTTPDGDPPSAAPPPAPAVRRGYRLLGAVTFVGCLGVILITLSGGFSTRIAGIEIRANQFQNPLLGIAAGVVGRWLLRLRYQGLQPAFRLPSSTRFYATSLLICALLSMGEQGPYRLLFAYAPGFNGLRAVARIHVVSMLCLAVLAAFGIVWVHRRLASRSLAAVTWALPLLLLMEQFSAPLPLYPVGWGEETPAIYRWLAEQPGDHAAIEVPLNYRLEFERLLYATVHEKMLVNGASGYVAPVYAELADRSRPFPTPTLVDDLITLGVRWIVVHRGRYGDRWPIIEQRLADYREELRPVAEIGDALVLETPASTWRSRRPRPGARAAPASAALPNDRWTASASANPHLAHFAVDGDITTRWHSPPQSPGDWFAVDLGGVESFDRIDLLLDRFPHDYPRGWRIEVSNDGESWSAVSSRAGFRPPIEEFLAARGIRISVSLPTTRARYVRVTQTGRDPVYVWSIHEIELRRGDES